MGVQRQYFPIQNSWPEGKFYKDGRNGLPARPHFCQALNPRLWAEYNWRWGLTLLEAKSEGYMH